VSDPLHTYSFVLDSILILIRVYFPSIYVLNFSVHMNPSQESFSVASTIHVLLQTCSSNVAAGMGIPGVHESRERGHGHAVCDTSTLELLIPGRSSPFGVNMVTD
jgi:hypothetical protein